jgi:hypothetical protein
MREKGERKKEYRGQEDDVEIGVSRIFALFSRTFAFSLSPYNRKNIGKDCRVVVKHPIKRASYLSWRDMRENDSA